MSRMGNDAAPLQVSLRGKLNHVANCQAVENGHAAPRTFEIQCSWSPSLQSADMLRKNYAFFFVDVNVAVQFATKEASAIDQQSDGLKELLTTVQSITTLVPGTSWLGRVLVVVPTRSGWLSRTKCFQERFVGCAELGIINDRTIVGQLVESVDAQELRALLDGSVLMLVRSANDSRLIEDVTTIEEVHARINFDWLLDGKPKQKTLAIVDGHLNLDSYLPMYHSAVALGMKVIVLDRPGHWISDPALRHLYEEFIPIDMTPDDEFHLRIAKAVKAYGDVDGLVAIATACLAPTARAALMLGLPAEDPDAVAFANNKYQMRLVAGGATPTTIVTGVPDLKKQMAEHVFDPQYPLIVKPNTGAGSAYVAKVETQAELTEGVRRISEDIGKKVLIEAYIDGPELDVNLVLLEGELIFFEISDDFPSQGDHGTLNSDFLESASALPSKLPVDELNVVVRRLHQLLLKIGLNNGIFHLEARVQNSSMAFVEKDGLLDLRPRPNIKSNPAPRCFLIEINPRPPGFQSVIATEATYGVNYYDLHVLASLGEFERFRSFAKPFDSHASIPNHARAWSEIVFLRVDKGGICTSDDVCGDLLKQLDPDDRGLVAASTCFYRRGMLVPEPKPGVPQFGAFFFVISRRNRADVLRVSRFLQERFTIQVNSV